jgi:hypothetical protein
VRPGTDEHHDYRGYAGQVAGGVLRPGDDVVVLPSGARSRIAGIETFDGPVDEAFPPMSVTIHLEHELDISRGDVLAPPDLPPLLGRRVDATICWMSETPSQAGGRYVVKHLTRTTRAVLEEVAHRVDVTSLERDEEAVSLGLNDIGHITLRTATPLAFDPYARNRATGSFILIDEATNDTVAAGMLRGTAREAGPGTAGDEALSREERWRHLGVHGATVWLTGASAASVAATLEARLVELGTPAFRVEPGASSEPARAAALLADAGLVAIVAAGAADERDAARRAHADVGLELLEVDAEGDASAALEHAWSLLVERHAVGDV